MMRNHSSNEAIERRFLFCTIACTQLTHPSPNTRISPAEQYSILLKINHTQKYNRTCYYCICY